MKDILPTLPPKERQILELLIETGPMFGLQLVGASHGRLKRGTVYVTLKRMESKGFIESEQEDQAPGATGLPRRIYKATAHGSRVLELWTTFAQQLAWDTT